MSISWFSQFGDFGMIITTLWLTVMSVQNKVKLINNFTATDYVAVIIVV